MLWHTIDTGTIISGVSADGVPYLKSFLIDYKNEFHVETVNAACQKCIHEYHRQFIKKFNPMESKSKYKLLSKREGIQLEFGSNVFVTNQNLTDEYAEILIERYKSVKPDFKMSDLFEIFPVKVVPSKSELATETTQEPEVKKIRTKRRK